MRKFLWTTALLVAAVACQNSENKADKESSFGQQISIAPVISKGDNLSVSLGQGIVFTSENGDEIFDLSPSPDGSWVRNGESEFIFSPSDNFESGATYLLTIDPSFISGVDKEEKIDLSFAIIRQDFEVRIDPLTTAAASENPAMQLQGVIETADITTLKEVKNVLSSVSPSLSPVWKKETSSRYTFAFEKLPRENESYDVSLTFDGNAIGVEKQLQREISIPSLKDFLVLSAYVTTSDPKFVSISFSDPIKGNQELEGIVQIEGDNNSRIVVNNNELRIFPSKMLNGSRQLTINPGLENTFGYKLDRTIERTISFDPPKPELKLIGSGSILPSTDDLFLPFEAIGLNSVQVDVIKVHQDNLPQFFQVNEVDGEEQTRRVGKRVYSGNVDLLSQQGNPDEWMRYTLDLSDLFEKEKGALYRVVLSMRPENSAFDCVEAAESRTSSSDNAWSIYDDDGFNTYGNYFSYYYPQGYNWSERDNPCHVSYYTNNRSVSTNLLASDIGLIAKIGADNKVFLFTTGLTTAEPIAADIEILDFQLQTLQTGKADAEGFFSCSPAQRPFLAIASYQGQKSYVKLDDGSALSTSNFNVSGQRIRQGTKGFIYGERGAWRPGDDIYLGFILESADNQYPADYPVKFELRDPSGQLTDEQTQLNENDGFFTFKTSTEPEAKTGSWLAQIRVGNQTFSKTLKIETIKPNRLKVNVDFAKDQFVVNGQQISGQITANWLTGLSSPGLAVTGEVIAYPIAPKFDELPAFVFQDGNEDFYFTPEQVIDGKLDDSGKLNFSFTPDGSLKTSGFTRLRLNTKVYEPGGGFSQVSNTVDYIPYTSYAGVRVPEGNDYGMLSRNDKHKFEVVAVSPEGKPISRSVNIKIYKLSWRWWWDQQDYYSASYIARRDVTPIVNKNVDVSGGKTSFSVDGNDFEWGRHLIIVQDLSSGHQASDIFYMGWSDGEQPSLGASFLSMTTSAQTYKVNDKVQVTLPSTVQGRALVTVENGSTVLDQFWINTSSGKSSFEFTATKEMTPNIYVNVSLIQPHSQTTNDLPVRMYGILPLAIEDPATRLTPEIQLADELAPGKEFELSISESNGQPMTYTVAIVDEGLLDITGFKTPDPWSYFYQKEALGVKTWDLYDDVIGAYGGRLERMLAVGGGADIAEQADQLSDNRFEPVVLYAGPFQLRKGRSETHKFTMPQYIGSVKAMVVVAGDNSYGSTDQTAKVVQPLMVQGTLPRVVGPGEEVYFPVNSFRYRDNINSAKISVKTSGLLNVQGESSANVNFGNDSETSTFLLKVPEKVGSSTVTSTATSGSLSAEHKISIRSRASNPPTTETKVQKLAAGETMDYSLPLVGIEGTNRATLTLSKIPSINLEKRLDFLIRYPHGCIEQTTSSVFPQLFLNDILELEMSERVKIEENIKAGIKRISSFQTYEGGFSYWPGSSSPSDYGTIYATHFLVEAEKKGYYIPSGMLDKSISYLRGRSRSWTKGSSRYNDDLLQAYRLFVLALGGKSDLSSMNRFRNLSGLSKSSMYRLAAAYAATGREELATELVDEGNQLSRQNNRYYYSYGSETRDLAMLLETYVVMNQLSAGYAWVESLAKELSSNQWMSTQTTAYSLLAVSKYISALEQSDKLAAEVAHGSDNATWSTDMQMISGSLDIAKGKSLSVKNTSGGDLFVTVTTSGTPLPGQEAAKEKGLSMSVSYTDKNGLKVDPARLKIGESFEIAVTVRNSTPQSISDIALEHILPSGWEINNRRLNADEDQRLESDITYQDTRDDRVNSYFDLSSGQSKTVTISVTAAYAGSFYLPAILAEPMYDASFYARSQGQWIIVKGKK